MYSFRTFRNTDPPELCRLWTRQPRQRGLMYPLTSEMLEAAVLCRPFFDREGLVIATRDDSLVGFSHAGFGERENECWVSAELGVTCMVMVDPELAASNLAADLLARSEEYLMGHGALVLYAGGVRPVAPFYQGIYGGSELPGVLLTDSFRQELYRGHAYEPIDEVAVLHRDLASFRPPVSRELLQVRRQTEVRVTPNPRAASWWEAATTGGQERVRYELLFRGEESPLAGATFWDVEPLASSWHLRMAGLTDLGVRESHRRQGLATHLLSETFRELREQGLTLVEAQVMRSNEPALALYRKLGFTEIDAGTVFRKKGAPG